MMTLVLLGKSGSGKSATGNSILGKKVFIVSTNIDLQDVSSPVKETADVEARKLTVIDGLDICQCEDKADFSSAELALKHSGVEGISAFLIVLKYGDIYGIDDFKVVDRTKAIFGTDVFRSFGICILTFGDHFQRDLDAGKERFKSVEEWFQQQSGSMQELFKECNKRCVLFNNNNRATTDKEKKEQVHNLIRKVKYLNKENGQKYTCENYKLNEPSRSELRKLLSQRKRECHEPSQAYYLQKTESEPEEHSKSFPHDFGTQSKLSSEYVCKSKEEFQSQNIESERTDARSSYSLEMSNVENTIMVRSDSDSHPTDQFTSSEVEMSDVSERQTSTNRKKDSTSLLTTQHSQKPDYVVNEIEMNARDRIVDVSGRVEKTLVVTDSEIDEMKKKIENKETELIDLYKETLTFLDTSNDDKRDLKKDVHEKMDFFEKRAALHRGPKRQKLEEGSDNSCMKTPDQTHLSNEVTLLLVGSAGNGKSATGNSILGRQVFKTTASTSAQCSDSTMECGSIKDVKVSVVDGPGVDTDKSPEEILQTSIRIIEKGLKLCDYRFSALLIVLKYGARFTKQESDFIKTLKGILGKNVIRDYGVCIITHGDNFDADNEDENLSFKEWCQQQEGQIKDLLEECNARCVLFNNRTKDPSLNELQVNQLLEFISKDKSYSKKEFAAAFKDMQKLIIETNAPKILEETKSFISKTRTKMADIPVSADTDKQFMSYTDVLNDVNAFEQKLLDEYGDPDNIKQSYLEIKVLRMEINNKLKTCLPIKKRKENTKEALDKVGISTNASYQHPLYQHDNEVNDFDFLEDAYTSSSQAEKSSSVDRCTGRYRRAFSESGTEGRDISGRSQQGVFREGNVSREKSQSHHIAEIYQRLNFYKTEIEILKVKNSPRETWKSLKGVLENEEKGWNILKCSITDPGHLEEKIFAIKGMFSQYMPKSEKSIWKLVKSYWQSFNSKKN